MIQHEPDVEQEDGFVPLVMMTHTTAEGAVSQAILDIDRLNVVQPTSVRMRVLD